MINTIDLFTTPLFRTEYPNANNVKNILIPIFKEIESKDETPFDYGVGGYTSFGKGNVLTEIPECVDLYYWIRNIIFNIHQEVGLDSKIEINNSWFSINRKYSSHEEHHHIPAIWSGVYYLQADHNDASITFTNPGLETNWPYSKISEFNAFNTKEKSFPINDGVLLVFPGYLKHKVDTQLAESERITIAFNASHFAGEIQ
jgi:uncharacterized protein (TIGR02466 family)